jgi:extracellular factor (EF) 3-hydroxypalmitic acid methyl ester biosynthesis protein
MGEAQAPGTPQKAQLLRLLDRCAADLENCDGPLSRPIVTPIASALSEYRNAISGDEWLESIRSELQPHPILARLHEDPYSSYGFRKPRGYAGDAVLLDFIYGGSANSVLVENASPLGAALYRECMQHPSFLAIRSRRDYLRDRLAALCRSGSRPHILSVACGHLREADSLYRAIRPGRFVALDQDPVTLEVAQSEHRGIGVELVEASVLKLLRSGRELGAFDFIYSAGLYDYLSDDVARRLTAKLAGMLNPGGRLLVANMLPELPSAAYMEAVMDWWLVYRPLHQLKNLAGGLGSAHRVVTYLRPFIAYIEIENGDAE